jgi:6-phosphogluconolactonase
MSTHVVVKPDAEHIALAARDWLIERIFKAIAEHDQCTIAASGGSTPKRLYALLASLPTGTVDWSKVHWIWGDERNVPIEPQDPDKAAKYYEATLHSLFASHMEGDWPRIDVAFLGIGDDAHTASLFPGSAGLHEQHRWVVSHWIEKLNAHRISLTAPVFNASKDILFLVSGSSKREALQHIWHDPYDPDRYPAQLIRPTRGDVWWMVDEAAVAGLPLIAR